MKIRHTIENESTWEKLKAAVVAGTAGALIQPFNEIDLTLGNGEAVTVVAAAHLPAAEDKPAALRFVFKDCLAEPHQMNKTWTNRGGYRASEGRRHLLEDVLPLLPADLRAVIRPRKITEITEGKTLVYEDPLWLPSETDVFGRGHESLQNGVADGPDDFQLPIFLTERDRVKQREGYGTTPWSLRSVNATYANNFCRVNTNGNPHTSNAYYSWAVAPGFDI